MVRRHRGQATTADRCDTGALGLDPPPRLRIVGAHDERLLAGAHLQRQRALSRLGQKLVGREAVGDLARQPEPLEPAGREHDRVQTALAALP